ncbi:MAG: apolipoprotein N-acyltransferase [Syntrophobacteraceae bacterium]|nr:apolipoprotein N-acyltransferase [Syntrophobacteraceae bacterium]
MMWVPTLLSATSGILLTLGFPKGTLPLVSWFALVPLLIALRGRGWKEACGLGFLCGLLHFLTMLYWILYVVDHYGGLPLPVAASVLLLLCLYLAVYPALFALVAHLWEDSPRLWIFGLPGVWVALEWVRAHALSGFPWGNLGYSQTPFLTLIQVADVTGVYGLSWLLVCSNTALAGCLLWPPVRKVALPLMCVLLGSTLIYGSWRLEQIRRFQSEVQPWYAAIVQGNIDQSKKWDPAFQQETLRRYGRLTRAAVGSELVPDLIVWPETATPFFYGVEENLTRQVNEIIAETGKPLLFGSPAITLAGGEPSFQNRAYLVSPTGRIEGAYAKRHLVPFGEYVPFKKLLFFVHRLVQAAGDFSAGHDPAPIRFEKGALGVLICYEGIFPDLARSAVKHGAATLVNVTNDAWYGKTSAPYQHLEISRWRAIEFRRSLIRAANTGISTLFDATGADHGRIPLDEEGFLVCPVRSLGIQTLYASWGDFFAWICVVAAGSCLFFTLIKRRRGSIF